MHITRQADYAVRAVLHLARLPAGQPVATARIARDQAIPHAFLAKIAAQLSTAGLVQATRGAHGGLCLARPAADISLLDVVEAMDGPLTLNECTLNPGSCPFNANCVVRVVWCQARADLAQRLAATRFDQLALAG
jgi:Rrf2 family protein